MLKRYKIIKIVYAKNFKAAMEKDAKTEPVEVCLDESIDGPEPKQVGMGFKAGKDD